eukprot:NODE_340_length_9219_cov_0.599452.p2 type:complete len:122 gc:universal NODE_340_length_9219_cov_0.599452:1972-2337(+)
MTFQMYLNGFKPIIYIFRANKYIHALNLKQGSAWMLMFYIKQKSSNCYQKKAVLSSNVNIPYHPSLIKTKIESHNLVFRRIGQNVLFYYFLSQEVLDDLLDVARIRNHFKFLCAQLPEIQV